MKKKQSVNKCLISKRVKLRKTGTLFTCSWQKRHAEKSRVKMYIHQAIRSFDCWTLFKTFWTHAQLGTHFLRLNWPRCRPSHLHIRNFDFVWLPACRDESLIQGGRRCFLIWMKMLKLVNYIYQMLQQGVCEINGWRNLKQLFPHCITTTKLTLDC